MKTLLLGLKGNFSKSSGLGIQRYMFELYKGLHRLDKNISKREINPIKFIGNGLSFALKTFFMNFDSYQIVHNLEAGPFLNYKHHHNYILITTAHDFQSLLYPEFTEHGVTLKYRLWLELVVKFGLRCALKSDYLLANSTQTKEEAIRLGYNKDKIFVVNLGLDKRFRSNKTIRHNKTGSIFRVGYIGAFRRRKNLEFAISAMNKLKDKKIYFDIWGKKDFEYEHLIETLKNKNIKFKGFAPEHKLIDIYDSFDLFVFPSYHEGEGLPILEAQARGLPVIIYKYGKIPKEVRKYCFEAKSPEHMAQIIENIKENGYNERLRKKATEYARSFTWEKCAKETLKVYEKVAK
ncbi:MAG: glycosyltransferase family 1 protein [Candidatus Micrarchaeaceae archaeon]